MPYIKQSRRDKLDKSIDSLTEAIKSLDDTDPRNLDGDLNYSLSRILLGTFDLIDNPKYTKFNSAIGVLEAVKLELYRRFTAPYEDKKIQENGDILSSSIN